MDDHRQKILDEKRAEYESKQAAPAAPAANTAKAEFPPAAQLVPYIERFGLDKIYTLTFESFINDPVSELKCLFDWLGVDANIPIKSAGSTHNALPKSFKKVKGSGLLHDFRSSFIWNSIALLIPDKINLLYIEDDESSADVITAILDKSKHTKFNIVNKTGN